MAYMARITPSYVSLRSLYLGTEAMKHEHLEPGMVTALLEDDDDFAIEGKLNPQGYLSGMAKLYRRLTLKAGMELAFDVNDDGNLIITPPEPLPDEGDAVELEPPPKAETVFARMGLKRIHIEPFRPENLDNWEPENETDVYMAFGVLQEFTDFQYCCATSKALLDRLGALYQDEGAAKPDAILIDRTTDEYLMAEWKKFSSDYKSNHGPQDVDVLVCWHDNEKDRTVLPPRVLALHGVAKTAAITKLGEG